MSRFLPIFLIAAGLAGCICSALHKHGLGFAVCSLVVAIGWNELRETTNFNESN
jgi:hypothetical protein